MLILRKKEAAEIEPAPAIRINQVMIAKSAPGESQPPVYLYLDGNQAGPYEVNSVRDMLELGTIPITTHYWREGMSEWRSLSEL
jgi:hypothetical protein